MKPLLKLSLSACLVTAGAALAQTSGANGPVTPMSDAQITRQLEAQGYSNVRITDHDKSHVDVTANKDGKAQKLALDPRTGRATADTDKN